MRPQILFDLFKPVTALPGVGPRIEKLIEKAAGGKVVDLLWHLPSGIIDRRYAPLLAEAIPGRIATVTVTIDEHAAPKNRRQPYRVACHDASGELELVFFNARADWLSKTLPPGSERVISGTIERYQDRLQMTHPDHMVPVKERETVEIVEPVYPLTAGLSLKVLRKALGAAVGAAPTLPEWQDPPNMEKFGFADWKTALQTAHAPESEADLLPTTTARQRLAYDEMLASQLAISVVRGQQKRLKGRELKGTGELRTRLLAELPFALTGAQNRTLGEIDADMASGDRMIRLLQGDVGSGKTVMALLAMLTAVETGGQAAMMAPTEILARQHFATLEPLCRALDVRIALLTGRDKGKAREQILLGLADGTIKIVVGTHALFQEDVAFKELVLSVVDEQHRFGVHQRLSLSEKGRAADVLVMTATPIPRTLLLSAYGDMDVSKLDEKPPGRQEIETRIVALDRLDEMIGGIKRAIAGGARVYWICPLVEDSEVLDVSAATERHGTLLRTIGPRVGLVHGRIKGTERDKVMAAFAAGDIDVLVATTVVEVGVDVPEATVMVVEHAERFGLAQLHQLRGRIGRGDKASTCMLLYAPPLSETAKARLAIMRETNDGFRIAEEDLRLRGAGEVLGTRQSGFAQFRMADVAVHGDLLQAAWQDARVLLDRDPDLISERGQAARVLLYLFERDLAIKYLRSG